MQIETAEDAAEVYKSFDGWQYADREATWKWMFEHGRIAGVADREREIEDLRADAERYRWLRAVKDIGDHAQVWEQLCGTGFRMRLNFAIDEAHGVILLG